MNRKMKSGFTVVELMLSITFFIGILVMFRFSYVGFNRVFNKVDVINCNNSILSFVNTSKQYCRENYILGRVYFSKKENTMMFYTNMKKLNEYELPKGFQFTFVNAVNSEININRFGRTSNGCTIKYRDRNNEEQEITISVGTGHVQIK
ncbi:prepilin-type cleavage/methylation domain-containing protein [uncultured Clostridium sp.]|uniref:type II secretion system protein n=1 Tax=uncultured Clostridium sp. TaxID=59620 RepID=UPI0028E5EDE3|nr:prepilin-type cleavage/methylation domain-containing protein [uncultured Clostridium sp.]